MADKAALRLGGLAPLGRDRGHHHRRHRGGQRRPQIKTGSLSRSDRIAKYNQLLRIEARARPGALRGPRGVSGQDLNRAAGDGAAGRPSRRGSPLLRCRTHEVARRRARRRRRPAAIPGVALRRRRPRGRAPQGAVGTQRTQNDQLAERNRQLAAEVRDLKTGMDALEERARSDLGMIAQTRRSIRWCPPAPATPATSRRVPPQAR